MCKKTTEDLKYVSRRLQKWKEKTESMDIIECKYVYKVRWCNFDQNLDIGFEYKSEILL